MEDLWLCWKEVINDEASLSGLHRNQGTPKRHTRAGINLNRNNVQKFVTVEVTE